MKKIYLLAISLVSTLSLAQQTISFESGEGFTAGNINGQGTWISTPTGGTPANVPDQVVTTEDKTDGLNSLKITTATLFGTQSGPIIGAFNNLSTPLNYTNFTLSFDVKLTNKSASASDFDFEAVGYSGTSGYYVARFYMGATGTIRLGYLNGTTVSWNNSATTWDTNTWYRVKIVGSATGISYYLNNTLLFSGAPISNYNISELRFVHDNYTGSAFIDNIKINNETFLATNETAKTNSTVAIYPNPTTDFISIKSPSKIKNIEIFDITGRKIDAKLDGDKVDVQSLAAGSYLLNIETEGRNFTEKFIKK